MRRRDFIAGLGGAAAWPLAAWGQQPAMPLVACITAGAPDSTFARYLAAFRAGLGESGFVEGRNVLIEYHWLEGQYDRVPALVGELVRHRVAVIAMPGGSAGIVAAKAATTTIPIVFGVGEDPVRLGLVASLAHPGGNATGVNFFSYEAIPKRLGLLHQLVPNAARMGVLVNPGNIPGTESTLREVQDAARAIGLSVLVLQAGTGREIEDAFATLARERVEALFITGDSYFTSRLVQFATLAARHGIAAAYSNREFAEAGGLMTYSSRITDMFRQVGAYTGQILEGAKPSDLPVMQSTKFELVINLNTAKALGLTIPPNLLALADEVIE